jgi:cytochrome P450
VLHRLTQEFRGTFKNEKDNTVATTSNLPYLNAVIDEGMRLCPSVPVAIPRVVPKSGDTVCGQRVPEGKYAAVNQYSAYRQSYNFRNPNSFIPERFLNPDSKADDMAVFQPFQVGRHNCIGMKYGYMELRLTLSRLLWAFDVALADPEDRWDWGDQSTYALWVSMNMIIAVTYTDLSLGQEAFERRFAPLRKSARRLNFPMAGIAATRVSIEPFSSYGAFGT